MLGRLWTIALEVKANLQGAILKTCKYPAKDVYLKYTMDSQNNSRWMNSLISKWAKAIKTFKQLRNISGVCVFILLFGDRSHLVFQTSIKIITNF